MCIRWDKTRTGRGHRCFRGACTGALIVSMLLISSAARAVPPCPALEGIDAEGRALYSGVWLSWDVSDFDGNGMADSCEVGVLAEVLCRPSHPCYSELLAGFDYTINTLHMDPAFVLLGLQPYENVLASLILLSTGMKNKITDSLYLAGDFYSPYVHFLSGTQPFSASGDPDADGVSNYEEYQIVVRLFGSRADYIHAALTPKGLDSAFAPSLKYLYELDIPIVGCLLCANPLTKDLDQNGMVDYAQAFMVDCFLASSERAHYGEVAAAWLYNYNVVGYYVGKLPDLYWYVVDKDKIKKALTGLVTLGDANDLAAFQTIFQNKTLTGGDPIAVDLSLFNTSAAQYIGVRGDADGDQVCNLSEYNAVSHDLAGFMAFAGNALDPAVTLDGGGCEGIEQNGGELPETCPALEVLDAEGAALYAVLGHDWATADVDENGLVDSWEAALLADVLCDPEFTPYYLNARKKFTGNYQRLQSDGKISILAPYATVLAALMTISGNFCDKFTDDFNLTGFYYPYKEPAITGPQALSGGGDPDEDTLSNKVEYNQVVGRNGTREDYVYAAKHPYGGGEIDRCVDLCGAAGGPCAAQDFNAHMAAVDSALAMFRDQLGGYSFDPWVADINGGVEGGGRVHPNGILDSDEFALINFMLTRTVDLSAAGGPTSAQVCDAWNRNVNQMLADLGGGGGLVNLMSPTLRYVLAAYILLGDDGSVAIPVTAMTAAAGYTQIRLGVVVPNLANYTRMPEVFGPGADPDGDGYTNLQEHACFRARSRCCYLLAALDPTIVPGPGQCLEMGEGEAVEGEGALEGEEVIEGDIEGGMEGAPEGEGEGADEGEGEEEWETAFDGCRVVPCPLDCVFDQGLDAGFQNALSAIYANPLLDKDPATADLDHNGIVDSAHARLVDAVLADPADPEYCCIRLTYEHNLLKANEYADQVQAAQPVLFLLIPRDTIVKAIAGLMTLGESSSIAIIADALNDAPIELPLLNPGLFNRAAEQYFASAGDADLDGVCNLGEYRAAVSTPDDFMAFVAAARNPWAQTDGGGCPNCDGEGGVEGENEGAIEGEGAPEGEGADEGETGCLLYESAEVPQTISDYQQPASGIDIGSSITITDVNVSVNIAHASAGDLTLWLRSPSGATVFLATQGAAAGANFTNTVFDDESPYSILLGTPPYHGVFAPVDSLAAFIGENARGEWKLFVFDGRAQNTGTLDGWSLTLNNSCGGEGVFEGIAEGASEGSVEGGGMEGTPDEGEPAEGEMAREGQTEGETPGIHSADLNGDLRINVSELLRVIQFYNSRAFSCDTEESPSEDGYVPGAGEQTCRPHSSDYFGGPNWKIDLYELLRLIQLYNSSGYHVCTGSEDGFCPGVV